MTYPAVSACIPKEVPIARTRALTAVRPLREEVYLSLRRALLDGVYPPGAPMVEADLAARLDASRTPVREALHKLELEGFLERVPGAAGLRVAALSPDEVEEIYGVRAVLEGYAARLAVRRVTAADLERLAALLDGADAAVAAGDRERLLALTNRFHATVTALAGSARLESLLRGLEEQVLRYRRATLEIPGQGELAAAEHRAIAEALAAGDAARAERLATAHVERKMRDVARHLKGALA
jgi:DNA-binding GntR family transcriptional regulator